MSIETRLKDLTELNVIKSNYDALCHELKRILKLSAKHKQMAPAYYKEYADKLDIVPAELSEYLILGFETKINGLKDDISIIEDKLLNYTLKK